MLLSSLVYRKDGFHDVNSTRTRCEKLLNLSAMEQAAAALKKYPEDECMNIEVLDFIRSVCACIVELEDGRYSAKKFLDLGVLHLTITSLRSLSE